MAKYVCSLCGTILEGDVAPTECPMCYARNDRFCVVESSVNGVDKSAINAENYSNWNHWREMPVGHGQAVTAIQELLGHTDAFMKELKNARTEWQNAKEHSQQIYDSVRASATAQCENEKTKYESECQGAVNQQENRKNTLKSVYHICSNFVDNVPSKNTGGAQQAARAGLNYVESAQRDVRNALDAKIQAYLNLRNCQIAESERLRNEKIDRARTEQIDRDTQAEHRY